MKNIKLTVRMENILGSIVSGILWMLLGFCIMRKTVPSLIIGFVLLLAIAIIYFLILFFNDKDGDEMSDYNLLKSKAKTFEVLLCAVMVLSLFSSAMYFLHIDFEVDWQGSMMFTIGMMKFFSGIYFYRFEQGKE
jgi:hypothetical protein